MGYRQDKGMRSHKQGDTYKNMEPLQWLHVYFY